MKKISLAAWRRTDLARAKAQRALDRVFAHKLEPDGLKLIAEATALLNAIADRAEWKAP